MQNGEVIASTLEATCDVEVDIVAELRVPSSRERLPRGVSSDLPRKCRSSVVRIKDIVLFRKSEKVKSSATAPNVAVALGLRTRKHLSLFTQQTLVVMSVTGHTGVLTNVLTEMNLTEQSC